MANNYKTVTAGVIPDYQDSDRWVKSKAAMWDGVLYQCKTRGFRLWNDLVYRTIHPSHTHTEGRRSKLYAESVNLFEDFDTFVEWCLEQHGYMNREVNGKFWQLDKDLLVSGNKNYGPDFCVFLPNDVNSLFVTGRSQKSESGLPLGVSLYQRDSNQFIAQCQTNGTRNGYLGKFSTVNEAHAEWQKAKIGEILRHSGRDDLSDVVKEALFRRAMGIQVDLLHDKETKFY